MYKQATLREKCLCITVTLGPFENKAFTHCKWCRGRLWKQSSLLIHNVAAWPHWKQGTLHISVA